MAAETTYLELSEADGGSHKFYEVVVDDTELTIRYGRIGDAGATTKSTFADNAKARAAAAKKIGEKVRKGYAPAVQGARAKRAVSRRTIVSTRSTAKTAPVLWRYRSGTSAFGIFVDSKVCMVGNEAGVITTLSHSAEVMQQFKLPDGVKCIVADDAWLYAGCDDGNVYDLSGKVPRLAYRIAPDIDIYWLDIHDGVLGVSDAGGGVAAIDHEDEFLWRRKSQGSSGWMVRCDADAVHHGHSGGVTSYDWRTGEQLWTRSTGAVLFGWQEQHALYAGTSTRKVVELGKDGSPRREYQCDAPVFSCATSPDGAYVFAGDSSSSVYCFDSSGTRLWKLGTGCGSAYSMQYHDERLFIVTTDGSLACIDATESAIRAAESGTVPEIVDVKAAHIEAVPASTTVEVVSAEAGADGVVLECFEEGGRLRVRVVSEGFQQSWQVQFPKGIREAGARYVVSEVRQASRGGFYRAFGEIRRLA
ncbi:WGR domain-containing protein [Catellatospora coxensis]|uniref:Molybdenum metabolism regulator n=1 Tax=Catellatospora coxensis TaxID=310354 RepID=A0A8J3PCU4_9ACTN|nr:WGR domain-containing protein [Catellatospora coxensis]GIG10361.1 molybdenum metabolism regulator [Catellatospora coxensis]